MTAATYLVTGCNRCIGLALVEQILLGDREARVIATARQPGQAEELQRLVQANDGRAAVVRLDLVRLTTYHSRSLTTACEC